ncbi:MAG TPA: DUF4259 domain-containing protein [Hyphomicrobiaceae bacterium]|nr:DUF4259 domain-containing protein [Hyphomicrobiaceae bacterium]
MGAWGLGPFDNDAATDWYLALIETKDLSLVAAVLDATITDGEFFDLSDIDPVQAACEVVLGLLDPEEFERMHKSAPEHVDPLAHGLAAVSSLQEESEPAAGFAIPGDLVVWVKQHRNLDASAFLVAADTILTAARERGARFYEGYFFEQGRADRWLGYFEGLGDRIKTARAQHAR